MSTSYLPAGWHVHVTTSADHGRAAVVVSSPRARVGFVPRPLWTFAATCALRDVTGAFVIAAAYAWRHAAEHRPVRAGGPRP
jgi:hypothetical protein